MKIILEDFCYKGHKVGRYICELPQVEDFDEIVQERIIGYLVENMDELIVKEEA